MQSPQEQLSKALRLLEAAEASLKSAQNLLKELAPEAVQTMSSTPKGETKTYEEGDSQVVEGYFDGQNMIGPKDKVFPVPANYASKSKLVEGDRLKLTILPNGSFVYKQISPTDRDFVRGTLVNEDGQYKVIANDKSYRVLLASVTYYKGSVGDEVTLILPKGRDAIWGAIEAVLEPMGENPEGNPAQSF